MRRHSSFLLRYWNLGSDDERIEIEHIQSGTKVLARSIAAAIEWICARNDDLETPRELTPDHTGPAINAGSREGGGV